MQTNKSSLQKKHHTPKEKHAHASKSKNYAPPKSHHTSKNQSAQYGQKNSKEFLAMSRQDMDVKGFKELDILLISGDAYIDHPAFAMSILGRFLEHHGFKVGIITQPDWKDPHVIDDLQRMGRPKLFVGISAGALDSMLAHYTAFRKKRHDDAYTPGGLCGARPNRAITVYTSLIRQAFPDLPVIAGGIEASLRRLSHYDFWTEKLRKSLLPDAKLDLIIYGMGERAILELARKIRDFYEENPTLTYEHLKDTKQKKLWQGTLTHIDGTARIIKCADIADLPENTVILPSHDDIENDPKKLIQATLMAEQHIHHGTHLAVQAFDKDRAVLIEKPASPLAETEMDILYSLPYSRKAHPNYNGRIPAETMMQTSMTCHRGCGGGCSFCSLALHQSRHISSRSHASLMQEAKKLSQKNNFDGAISDVGGPSANMWQGHCTGNSDKCARSSCMTPKICPHFHVDQGKHISLLRDIQKIPNIRHVRVASGIRFDLAMTQKIALDGYAGEFTGGQLKVAPEHCSPDVLDLMRKPHMENFELFLKAFYDYCEKVGKEQYVIPYLLSAFPGCTDAHMRELATWLAKRNWKPRQVQCFIPTPGTVATAMFYAECDTHGEPLFVAKSDAARLRQHGILMGSAIHPEDNWNA